MFIKNSVHYDSVYDCCVDKMQPLLQIKNLTTIYRTGLGDVKAVDHVTLDVHRKSAVGLVGESGCGKTSLVLSIMKLLPNNAVIKEGQVLLDGEDLLLKNESEMERIRWKKVSLVFQAAMNALNPVYRVGDQVVEAITTHESLTRKEAEEKVARLFELVGLRRHVANLYPHECSGGMKQRVIIAMALACDPEIVILDEATTALDTIIQRQIIEEIKRLQEELELTLLYISHDISVIAETCDRVGVLYAGRLLEVADIIPLLKDPVHPYTKALLSSFPSMTGDKRRLSSIPGSPPYLLNFPPSCRFHQRCPFAKDLCGKKDPELTEISSGHYVACHFIKEFR